MAFTLNDGQGTLHKNKFKEPGDKLPDYKGDLMTPGGLMEIAAWIKEGGKGKWMSLKVSPKREQKGDAYEAPAKAPVPDDYPPF